VASAESLYVDLGGHCSQCGPGVKPLVGEGEWGKAHVKLTIFHKMRGKFGIESYQIRLDLL